MSKITDFTEYNGFTNWSTCYCADRLIPELQENYKLYENVIKTIKSPIELEKWCEKYFFTIPESDDEWDNINWNEVYNEFKQLEEYKNE